MPAPQAPGPYRRVLLKLSGESFCKPGGFGIDADEVQTIAGEIKEAASAGAQVAVVVGGGNIIRGAELAAAGHIHRATADQMGMLGTVINALPHLEKGRVVILAAGTGNPFFTTDTCASLRATELECAILLKATKVDGVYSDDPRKNPSATRYQRLTFAEALDKKLRIMDTAALAMCQEHKIPVLVFDFKQRGNIRRVVQGESVGTLLTF